MGFQFLRNETFLFSSQYVEILLDGTVFGGYNLYNSPFLRQENVTNRTLQMDGKCITVIRNTDPVIFLGFRDPIF